MKVLFVSSEVHPYAKTGGLGDVAGTLPKYIYKQGSVDIRVILPGYRTIKSVKRIIADFPVSVADYYETAVLKEAVPENDVPTYLISNDRYFNRTNLYGYEDDAERFSFFCKAVLESLKYIPQEIEDTNQTRHSSFFTPDIIHCNDWHTGLIPVLVRSNKNIYSNLKNVKFVFTIHNLQYQGVFPYETLRYTSIPPEIFTYDKVEYYGKLNFLKGGIVFSDAVNTVSKKYAEEIQTKEFGAGLEEVLKYHRKKLYGILNGLDYSIWNPETDKTIVNYNTTTLSKKVQNKLNLQKEVQLPVDEKPFLAAFIGRLSAQKGIDLLIELITKYEIRNTRYEIRNTKYKLPCLQMIVLGVGDEIYMKRLVEIVKSENYSWLKVILKFDETLAHHIYAGSDVILIPSQYEPCGLIQLIAMKYGTIPVARKTGGLADTIIDVDKDIKNGTGFLFDDYSADEFYRTVLRAERVFQNKKRWQTIQKRCMNKDFSWNSSAKEYLNLYSKVSVLGTIHN